MTHLTSVLRRILLHRRLLAALAAALCVLAVLSIISGNGGPVAEVYVAAARIPAGTSVETDQVRRVEVPQALVPSGAISRLDDVSDHMTAVAVPSGAILTADSFVAASQAEPGNVIIPLTVSPQLLGVLKPGDRVSVFLSDLSTSESTVTRGIRVATIPAAGSGGLLSSSDGGGFVLVEVPESIAAQITSAGNMGSITVAIE